MSAADAVAIVGMAGRFPGAGDLDAFWRNLRDGVETVGRVSDDDLRSAGLPESTWRQPNYVRARGLLDGIDLFDAAFFRIGREEAELMDPQQRIFLECAWEACESAGYGPGKFPGSVGIYAGATASTYFGAHAQGAPQAERWPGWFQALVGNDKDYLASRVAYALDTHGPCIGVQTACSTSLVAVHLACSALLDGQCDMALAGGVTVRVPDRVGYLFEEGSLFSSDGHCRPFDADARGTVFGNGVGVVVLRRLEDALRDGDPIRAVILGSAINNDGAVKVGFTAPSQAGQARVIAEALGVAGVERDTIGYVEAHGTGTVLGDPIECAALKEVFGRDRGGPAACAIGSVKGNIGHLESAAGIAGLIKTVLALEHDEIPVSRNFERLNSHIDMSGTGLFVNVERRPWPEAKGPRRAGVSSFGIGGTNAHVILEQAPQASISQPEARPTTASSWPLLLPISARDPAALRALGAAFVDRLGQPGAAEEVRDIVYTAGVRRVAHPYRLAAIGGSAIELAQALARRLAAAATAAPHEAPTDAPRVVFLFRGGGRGWLELGRSLTELPICQQAFAEMDAAFRARLGWSLLDALSSPDQRRRAALDGSEPISFAVAVALANLWRGWGVAWDAALGQGTGRLARDHVTGAISLDEAVGEVGRAFAVRQASGATLAAFDADGDGADDGAFDRAVAQQRGEGAVAWIELSPDPGLLPRVRRAGAAHAIACGRRGEDPRRVLLEGLAELFANGYPLDWRAICPTPGRCVPLPSYPWQRQRYWIDRSPQRATGADSERARGEDRPRPTPRQTEVDPAAVGAELACAVREVLGLPPGHQLAPHTGFFDLGMDSLKAVKLRDAVQKIVGGEVRKTIVMEYASLSALTAHVVRLLSGEQGAAPVAVASPPSPTAPEPVPASRGIASPTAETVERTGQPGREDPLGGQRALRRNHRTSTNGKERVRG